MQDQAAIDSQFDLEPSESPRPPARSARKSRAGGDGALWILLGLGALAVGVGMIVAPSVSWTATKIAARLGQLGVQSGAALFGGLVLMALGVVRRGQQIARAEMHDDSALLVEHVTAELAELRASTDAMRAQSEGFDQALLELREQVLRSRDALAEQLQSLAPRDNNDALFQLAGGLDKLGLRVEQRLRLHHSSLQESVDELAATMEHSRRCLEDQLQSLATPAPSVDSSASACEPVDCAQTLATETYEPAAAATRAPTVAEPYDGTAMDGSLGLLDRFDDIASALPTSHAPLAGQPADDTAFGGGAAETYAELDRAARSVRPESTWDEQMMVERPDLDTKTKLLQLESLLSDDRLRAALDAMRRQS